MRHNCSMCFMKKICIREFRWTPSARNQPLCYMQMSRARLFWKITKRQTYWLCITPRRPRYGWKIRKQQKTIPTSQQTNTLNDRRRITLILAKDPTMINYPNEGPCHEELVCVSSANAFAENRNRNFGFTVIFFHIFSYLKHTCHSYRKHSLNIL